MSAPPQGGFTLAELKAFRYLAIVLGLVLAGICLVSPEPSAQFVAVGFVVAMIAAIAGVLWLLRKRKAGK